MGKGENVEERTAMRHKTRAFLLFAKSFIAYWNLS